ncbi:hypothetical protein ECHHL_1005 [Ehrlichia chaffeensis str. Heartland]|uniref:Uncharacterized protein n=1 Tax=Ehrlichia chaffeensis (strain ATCC CRL-10679 / Arkansas) TaxID=205920 RepID=Q2GI48_EHRCR|nr:hypothetical protein ECH_0054 [Ehrlichia chaffeensis str. Arkansas]AHX04130.1 hypothetical protein ECHHL_1005 [Ehrlichia chaffeensis str. Heartland]AHX06066.1 hypothetical protein ECHJAX_1026 [Ehrlichia chaffeensis str. Jax]AHX07055.1 hypothetical protein ECHLIB_1026 [Ehrlichia chaffeensis str. Liberty]AHX07906.1 hypothetical protein ECHOSC_1020 [Ehrlichia chaffeensis str. Osceola]AHX08349.1 hypothetical protein ECHSTV_1008 [Ehrlichia chaffeensis str. Saint Vincent]AHX09806.1 hypothetical 
MYNVVNGVNDWHSVKDINILFNKLTSIKVLIFFNFLLLIV